MDGDWEDVVKHAQGLPVRVVSGSRDVREKADKAGIRSIAKGPDLSAEDLR